MRFYHIETADMFRPRMWPSSGWSEQEYKYICNASESVHSLFFFCVNFIVEKEYHVSRYKIMCSGVDDVPRKYT
jgi:hypothetical protein